MMRNVLVNALILGVCSVVMFSCKSSEDAAFSADDAMQKTETVSEAQSEKKSIFQELQENNHLSAKESVALYYQLKKESPNGYNFDNEQELNRYGYALLEQDRVKDAIDIFELLVSEFPNAANPYDSLGEAYMRDGNEEMALMNYEKSVALDPQNTHAIDQVNNLKGLEVLVTDWGKEFFHFPLHFAEDIPYKGVEEVVFPTNWIKPDSADFWSYVFVWALDDKQEVTAEELEQNLTLYFDGLMDGLSRVDHFKLTKASVQFMRNTNPNDSVMFTGELEIFDGFATQEPITLNARIHSNYCTERDQLILLFRFSPLPYEHAIWDKLRTVEVRSTVCEVF